MRNLIIDANRGSSSLTLSLGSHILIYPANSPSVELSLVLSGTTSLVAPFEMADVPLAESLLPRVPVRFLRLYSWDSLWGVFISFFTLVRLVEPHRFMMYFSREQH
jgi:hypothetical protein